MFKRYTYHEGLTSLIESNGQYFITIKGVVKNHWGETVPARLDQEGYEVVHVLSWDGLRDYRIIDLMTVQFKDIHIPKENYNDIVSFPMDGNKQNVHAKNVGYRFKNKIEAKEQPGFYHIPAFTRYAISANGELYNTIKNTTVKWHIFPPIPERNIKGGYRTYRFRLNGAVAIMPRHRAMMLTFKEYPDNCDVLVVNHINGVPGDDRLENLEWLTRGQNNKHAYVTDLKTQHDRVLCRDVITGEVVEYYSISECARALGYPTDETIRQRLITSAFCKVFQDGKQFKYKDDKREWIIPQDPLKAIRDAKEHIEIVSKNCLTSEELPHRSAIDACRRTGVNDSTIIYRLNKDDRSPLYGYQFKYLNDVRPFPSFTKEEYEASLAPKVFKVKARNLLTKEEKDFDSVNIATKTIGNLNIPQVLRRGEQPLLPDGWQLKFENQEWEEIEDFEEEIYKRKKEIMARHEMTGKVIVAESARQMCDAIQEKDYKAIRVAALTRGNKVWHGYRFRLGITDEPWPTTDETGNFVGANS